MADSLAAAAGYTRTTKESLAQGSAEAREIGYAERDQLLNNTIYDGGGSSRALQRLGVGQKLNGKVRCLPSLNPVQEIVDAYSNLFPGTWNNGLSVAPKIGKKDVSPVLLGDDDPLGRLWAWSNLDTEKQKLMTWGPNLGTIGLRVYAKDDPDASKRRVSIQMDHPSRIIRFREDDRGNVTEVYLRYRIPDPSIGVRDDVQRMITVEEVLTKERLSRKYDGAEQLDEQQQTNSIGFCPYVILRHKDIGEPFGLWAYAGSEILIHQLNYLIALLVKSTSRAVFPKWYATGGGEKPQLMSMGEDELTYVKTAPDTPPPSLEAITSQIDFGGVLSTIERLFKALGSRNPELNLNNLDIVSGLSGETLQQFLKPIQSRILQARPNYDHALIRAMQMGLSYMQLMGLVDFGGGDNVAAAERAYRAGDMDFVFADRPALPLDVFQEIQQETLKQLKTGVVVPQQATIAGNAAAPRPTQIEGRQKLIEQPDGSDSN